MVVETAVAPLEGGRSARARTPKPSDSRGSITGKNRDHRACIAHSRLLQPITLLGPILPPPRRIRANYDRATAMGQYGMLQTTEQIWRFAPHYLLYGPDDYRRLLLVIPVLMHNGGNVGDLERTTPVPSTSS